MGRLYQETGNGGTGDRNQETGNRSDAAVAASRPPTCTCFCRERLPAAIEKAAAWHTECSGEEIDQLGVGGALDRRRVQADEQGAASDAGEAGPTGARDDADADDDAVRCRLHRVRGEGHELATGGAA
jgi:hypothetical protein